MGAGVEVVSLYYNEEENYMEDQEGNPVYDIHRIIPPWRLKYMKEKRGTEYIRKPGIVYELVFPLYGENDD